MDFPHSFVQICDKFVASCGWSLLDLVNLTIGHAHNSVCERLEADVVCYHDHRDLLLLVQVNENFHDDVCASCVEITCRLIEEQDFGLVGN